MKTAVIDVGSNSVRYAVLSPDTVIAKKQLKSTVLADGLFFSGRLSPQAIERTVDAIRMFCDAAKADNANKICIFATEAVRAASNGKEFTDAVYNAVGIAVDVIDGGTEAQIGFTGASPDQSIPAAVFDLGGASCEIICGENGNISYVKSVPIGCVRLHDGAAGSREKACGLIAGNIPSSLPSVQKIVGIGGTATALGAMVSCPDKYDPEKVHGSVVTADFLRRAESEFFAGENMQTLYPCLTSNRARVIGYGALASLRVLEVFNKNEFTVSERDNIEGYFFRFL